jgi:hypothetical protein
MTTQNKKENEIWVSIRGEFADAVRKGCTEGDFGASREMVELKAALSAHKATIELFDVRTRPEYRGLFVVAANNNAGRLVETLLDNPAVTSAQRVLPAMGRK